MGASPEIANNVNKKHSLKHKNQFAKFSIFMSATLFICLTLDVIVGLLSSTWVAENVLFLIFVMLTIFITIVINIIGMILGIKASIKKNENKILAITGAILNFLSLIIIFLLFFQMDYFDIIFKILDFINT